MTRKTISDLVRKEAEKPTDESPTELVESNVENDQKVELDAIASKLKDVLAESKHREDALHSEINRLNEEILDQKKHIVNLQVELGQTEKLKHDFAEAKATILKLTEAKELQLLAPILHPPEAIATLTNNQPSGQSTSAQTGQNFNGDSDIGSWLG